MSQMATYLCKIKNPVDFILEQSIEVLKKALNATYEGRIGTQITLRVPGMEYLVHISIGYQGQGIYVKSDRHCDRTKLEKISKQIEQIYLAMAHKAAMEAMGYQVNIEQNNTGDFIVQGVMG